MLKRWRSDSGFTGWMPRSNAGIAGLLLLLALFARWVTWFPASIDHDESTYLVIADAWLKGILPYTRYIDIKPLGIYALFAAAIKCLGHSVWSVRFLGTLFIWITALLVYLAARRLHGHRQIAMISGLVYILCASLHKWSWTSNTELFFNAFIAAGLWVLCGSKRPAWGFVFGLLLGLGFMIKYVVALDFVALGLFFAFANWRSLGPGRVLLYGVLAGLGFCLPFAAIAFYYWQMGAFGAWYDITFVVPARYSNPFQALKSLAFVSEFYLGLLPVTALYIVSLRQIWRQRQAQYGLAFLALGWPLLAWLAILSTGKLFFHYYFQALIPLVLLAPYCLKERPDRRLYKWVYRVLALGLLACPLLQYITLAKKAKPTREVAAYLNSHMRPEDKLMVESEIVLYFLTDKLPPTPYVHPTLITRDEHLRAYGIDRPAEVQRILGSRPEYWVSHAELSFLFSDFIQAHYREAAAFGDDMRVWKRVD